MTSTSNGRPTTSSIAASAKGALERVCSGAGLDPASRYYRPDFVDHVNDLEFRGLEGTQQSVDLYKSALDDLAVSVVEQIAEGERVVSRFVVTGSSFGRRVRFNGITISRFDDGRIIEDWSVTDTMGMLRQLGLWRSVVIGVRQWRALRRATASAFRSGAARATRVDQDSSVLRST